MRAWSFRSTGIPPTRRRRLRPLPAGYIFKNRVRKNYRLVPGSFPMNAYVFTAYVSDFSEKSPVDGVYEGSVTLAATGEPTFDVDAS